MLTIGPVVGIGPSTEPVSLEGGNELGTEEQAEIREPKDRSAKVSAL
jgi:hypothetical protein